MPALPQPNFRLPAEVTERLLAFAREQNYRQGTNRTWQSFARDLLDEALRAREQAEDVQEARP